MLALACASYYYKRVNGHVPRGSLFLTRVWQPRVQVQRVVVLPISLVVHRSFTGLPNLGVA